MEDCEYNTSDLTLVFHKTIASRREELESEIERIVEIRREMPCARENIHEIWLALREVLTNAVIHGNREDPSKRVQICGACEGQERFLLVVTDEGEGFDPKAIPDPTVAENVFSSHGRGVFLINRLMDQVEFRQGGRQVLLCKKRP